MWQLFFAATQIQKVVRGHKGRVYAAGYRAWWEKQEAKIRKVSPGQIATNWRDKKSPSLCCIE